VGSIAFIIFGCIYIKDPKDKGLINKETMQQDWFTKSTTAEKNSYENYLRYKHLNSEVISYKYTMDMYCPFDAYMISGGTETVAEIKVRKKYSYRSIKSCGGQMLEYKKLNGINEELKKQGLSFNTFLYFIYFEDRLCIYQLPLDEREYKWIEEVDKYQKNGSNPNIKQTKWVTYLSEKHLIEIILNK
jgi:hypothetical protein